MPNYKEMAHLRSKGISQRNIAKQLTVSRNTIRKAYEYFDHNNLSWDKLSSMSEYQVNSLFKPNDDTLSNVIYDLPDYPSLSKELMSPGVTFHLRWEEYTMKCKMKGKIPYGLTQFKKYFRKYLDENNISSVIKKKPGEKIEVDWAGTTIPITDSVTGEVSYAYLFVGALPFSGYIYAEVTPSMKQEYWISAHINMFNFFSGVSKILVPDNLKTGVTSHTKDAIVLNDTYRDFAEHYGTVVIPARIRKPKDKPTVERSVGILTTHMIARMRNNIFFSVE